MAGVQSPVLANHPNRSKTNRGPGFNPRPAEIVRAREAAGLTQTEAAELIFASLRTWQDWEGGQRRMYASDWELFRVKVKAMKLLDAGEISPAMLQTLGLWLPERKD